MTSTVSGLFLREKGRETDLGSVLVMVATKAGHVKHVQRDITETKMRPAGVRLVVIYNNNYGFKNNFDFQVINYILCI